jgi:hypothetical protein
VNQQLRDFLRGPAQSWSVSQGYAVWSILTFGVTLAFSSGVVKDFHTLFAFIFSSQFGFSLFMALVLGIGPYARAKQGADRVNNVNQPAVITPPAKPEKAQP